MWTIVTCLYDLSSREGNKGRRTIDDYLQYGKHLMRLDMPMIIFCDPDVLIKVWKLRQSHLNKTYFISKRLEDFQTYSDYKEDIVKCLTNNPVRNLNPIKDTALYWTLTFARLEMVKMAIALNPFDTKIFGWVDFGIYHVAGETISMIPRLNVGIKMKVEVTRDCFPEEIEDKKSFFSTLSLRTAGGFITGGDNEYMTFINLVFHYLRQIINNDGIAPTKEELLTYIRVKNPLMFDYYYGDFEEIICNYDEIRSGQHNIINNMRFCRSRGKKERALELCELLLRAWERNKSFFSENQFYDISMDYIRLLKIFEKKGRATLAYTKLVEELSPQCLKDHQTEIQNASVGI